jgi:manganese/zinc/iron transport system permease protein
MSHAIRQFFSFADINVTYVLIGAVLLAAGSAIVGCFAFLRKRTLAGDAVAHAALPGVCLAFLIDGTKDPIPLLIGATFTGWLSVLSIDWLTGKTRLKEDTAIALVLSVFFGVGIWMLTGIQQSGAASQTGLDKFLFGKAASLIGKDLWVFGGMAAILMVMCLVFYKEFALLCFDKEFAQTSGLPTRVLTVILSTMTVLAVVVGIQAVGVVLMAAMLITPAAAARYWTNNLRIMLGLAAGVGIVSGVGGAFISYVAPAMPTGPWMVMIISMIAMGSFIFAPGKGVWSNWLLQRRHRTCRRSTPGSSSPPSPIGSRWSAVSGLTWLPCVAQLEHHG